MTRKEAYGSAFKRILILIDLLKGFILSKGISVSTENGVK